MRSWFSLRRALAIFRVEARQLMADRSALVLIFGLPIFQILLYGYGVSFTPRHVPLALSTDSAEMATRLSSSVKTETTVRLVAPVGGPGAAERAVRQGRARLGVEVSAATNTAPVRVHIFADGSDPSEVGPVLARLQVGIWRRAAEASGGEDAPQIDTVWLYGAPDREAWAVAPGLIGVIVMVSMLFLGALTLVRERERGTWESLLATPIRPAEALAGKLAPYLLIGFVETVLLLVVVHLLFDVPLPLASLALIAAAPIFSAAYLLLGFVFSALAQSQLQAMQGAVAVYLPSLLLSGFLFPFSGMPAWARWVGQALPLTHYVRASREVLLRGAGVWSVAPQLAPIAGFAVAAFVAAVLAFRTRLD